MIISRILIYLFFELQFYLLNKKDHFFHTIIHLEKYFKTFDKYNCLINAISYRCWCCSLNGNFVSTSRDKLNLQFNKIPFQNDRRIDKKKNLWLPVLCVVSIFLKLLLLSSQTSCFSVKNYTFRHLVEGLVY